MTAHNLVINGAAGRMGQRITALAQEDKNFQIIGALDSAQHPKFGKDAGEVAGIGTLGISISEDLPDNAQVVIDFSTPAGTQQIVPLCVSRNIAIVVATTGLAEDLQESIRLAAKKVPVLWAPSMSLAVNLAMKLTETAALALKDYPLGADVEIIERHHRFKEDAPSGTALKFGEIIAGAMGQSKHSHGRHGRPGVRPRDEIGYHALRVGDNPGEHTIVFGLLGETLELSVKASSRDCYALGALAAATYIASRPAGLYSMNDVLGL